MGSTIVIDKVLEKSREFILESQVKNYEKNQTVFTYLDPNHINPKDPDYKEKQVIYIRDDSTGKIDVLYGAKALALVIERPDQIKNGAITKIDENKVKHYGEIKNDSIFQSFKKSDKSPNNKFITTKSYQNLEETDNIKTKYFTK